MGRTRIAVEVRDSLHDAELALLDAIAKYEVLQAKMVGARQALGLNGTVGDAALASTKEVSQTLAAAWNSAQETHEALDTLKHSLGFRHVAAFPKQEARLPQAEIQVA